MKKILTASLILLAGSAVYGQQKEGKVLYERTTQMQINFPGGNEEMQRMIPKSRTDKFELSFGNNLSLWKAAPQDNEDETLTGGDGGGMQIRMMVQGANDVLFNNFDKGTRIEQRELMDRKFIIDDSVRSLKWKMTGETRSILNHNCMKATATQISQRMIMGMNNGEMKRNEISDTSNIVAWFASDIPVPAGPAEYQGQLPGLILEMDVNNGRQLYKALNISPKADLASIKEPTGKKHYTPEEFKKERGKMMDEMQRNAGPGTRVIRVN
jgi:GLPGLI family protein